MSLGGGRRGGSEQVVIACGADAVPAMTPRLQASHPRGIVELGPARPNEIVGATS